MAPTETMGLAPRIRTSCAVVHIILQFPVNGDSSSDDDDDDDDDENEVLLLLSPPLTFVLLEEDLVVVVDDFSCGPPMQRDAFVSGFRLSSVVRISSILLRTLGLAPNPRSYDAPSFRMVRLSSCRFRSSCTSSIASTTSSTMFSQRVVVRAVVVRLVDVDVDAESPNEPHVVHWHRTSTNVNRPLGFVMLMAGR